MIFLFLLSLIAPCLAAFMILKWAFAEFKSNYSLNLLCVTLAVGLGLGMGSCTFFLWRIVGGPSQAFQLTETPLFLMCAATFFLLKKKESNQDITDLASFRESNPDGKRRIFLTVGFGTALTFALIAFVMLSGNKPHGGWDAWAIWNLHARFLFRGGAQWTDYFSPPIAWSHPDYPLLVPATVARFWTYLSFETVLVPALVAGLFTFGTVILIVSAFSVLLLKTNGLLAGLLLLGTGFFIEHGASQYADVPVGFFILSTVVIFALKDGLPAPHSRLVAIAGTMSALAAWTKNEGLLFIVAVVIARLVLFLSAGKIRQYLKEIFFFSVGLVPVMMVVALLKLRYAPPNDVMSSLALDDFVVKLTDISRYISIGKGFARGGMHFGKWLICLLFMYCCLFRLEITKTKRATIVTTGTILIIMLSGHFLVYIMSPYELQWHLTSSVARLLLQVWPAFLFLVLFMPKSLNGQRQGQK